jgi:hypothetical protein
MGDDLMGALGNTSITNNENIGALFSQSSKQVVETQKDDGKLKHNRSAKFTDIEIERLNKIKIAIGTDNDSKALRWCLNKIWESYEDEIKKIAEKKMDVGTL